MLAAMTSWTFLIVGTLAAVGAALAGGTGAALARYYRSGRLPGEDDADARREVTTAHLVGLWLRVVVGTVVAVWGIVSLARAGLL